MSESFLDVTPQMTRLILINSGKADYVEIEPDLSTHLAADNGEGKSSILNALQFLMIDDWNKMKFPKDNEDTSQFYFPSQQSHIIFEIRDDVNQFHQVWFTGRTSASKERYQRFVLHGRYRKELFLSEDEGKWNIHSSGEILETASLNKMKPQTFKNSKELRDYLRDVINWYPVSVDFQQRFFAVMRKLNQLSDMTPRDLKEVLIEVAQIKNQTLDFENEFHGAWSRLEHEGKIIDELRLREQDLKNLRDNLDRRKGIFETLSEELTTLGQMMNGKDSGIEKETLSLNQRIEELTQKRTQYIDEQNLISIKKENLRDQRADLKSQQKTLKVTRDWAENQSLESLEDTKNEFEEDYLRLRKRSERQSEHKSSEKTVEQIDAEIASLESKITGLKKRIEDIGGSLFKSIMEKGLPIDEVYWTKFNPELLTQKGEIVSKEEYLDTISNLNLEKGLSLPGVKSEPIALSTLEDFTDPIKIQEKLETAIVNHSEFVQLRTDIIEAEKLATDLVTAEKAFHAAIKSLEDFIRWNTSGKAQLTEVDQQITDLNSNIQNYLKKETEITESLKLIDENIRKNTNTLEKYRADVTACQEKWILLSAEHLGSTIPTDVLEFKLQIVKDKIDVCNSRSQDYERIDKKILEDKIKMNMLAHLLALDQSSEEFVTKSIERFTQIDVDEENLTTSWMHLQATIVKKANLLKEGVVEIRRELNSINSRFRKTEVSNLDMFQVNLNENTSEIKIFDSLGELGGFANFTRTEKEMKALSNFRTEVSKRSKIYLSNLFDLQFTIRNPGEEEKEIKRLELVGSTGTQTVVKTVLLLLLLSKFTKKKAKVSKIPVLLDEVGTLGSGNYSEILSVARALNFQIFTASPKSVSAANVVYPLLKGRRKGKLFCDPSISRPKPKTNTSLEEE